MPSTTGGPTATAPPDSGSYHGRWIAFEWQRSTCTVRNYTIGSNVVFAEVRGHGACWMEEQAGDAAGFRLFNANGSLRMHDVPSGLLRFHVYHGSMAFDIGPDVTIAGDGRDKDLLAHGARIHVMPTSPLGVIDWHDHGFVATDVDGNVLLRATQPEPERPSPPAVQEAVHRGRVAGEISIDRTVARGDAAPRVVPYEDVAIDLSRPNATSFRITVEAELDEGQTIVTHFGQGVLDHNQVSVAYFVQDADGVIVPGQIHRASDLDDVLDPAPGEGTEYWVVQDEQGLHVLFSVPHWSVHVFDVLGVPPAYVPVLVYGVVLSGLFIGVAAVGAFLSRREA